MINRQKNSVNLICIININSIINSLILRYAECGTKEIEALIRNPLTIGDWEHIIDNDSVRKTTITVLCPLAGLEIETSPVFSANRGLVITAGTVVKLAIVLKNGSYPTYSINWGDGTPLESVSHDDKLVPVPVYTEHKYVGEATYMLNVNATDKKGRVLSAESVQIKVSNCSVPHLIFNYGTPSDPLRYTRGQDIKFTGFWPYIAECDATVKAEYKYINASFNTNSQQPNVLPFVFDVTRRKLSYTIPARSYAPGVYALTVMLSYKGDFYLYNGYIEIVESPLKAVISNNNFQTLPTRLKDKRFYNSTLDATQSKDPDNQADGLTGEIYNTNVVFSRKKMLTRG